MYQNSFNYNLAIKYDLGIKNITNLLKKFIELGYNRFAIIYNTINKLQNHEEIINQIYSTVDGDYKIFSRFHISRESFSRNRTITRGDILKLRRKAYKKACILSIDDYFFKRHLNPNDSLKFNLITLSSPTFKMIIKLSKKPILFEYLINKETVSYNWLTKKLYIIKLLLEKNKLIVSPQHSLYSPLQIAYFIYGVTGFYNYSINVVSTLPIKLVEQCITPLEQR